MLCIESVLYSISELSCNIHVPLFKIVDNPGSEFTFTAQGCFNKWMCKDLCKDPSFYIPHTPHHLGQNHRVTKQKHVFRKQETTPHHLSVSGTFLEQLWKIKFSWSFWFFWDDFRNPICGRTLTNGQKRWKSTRISIDFNRFGPNHRKKVQEMEIRDKNLFRT